MFAIVHGCPSLFAAERGLNDLMNPLVALEARPVPVNVNLPLADDQTAHRHPADLIGFLFSSDCPPLAVMAVTWAWMARHCEVSALAWEEWLDQVCDFSPEPAPVGLSNCSSTDCIASAIFARSSAFFARNSFIVRDEFYKLIERRVFSRQSIPHFISIPIVIRCQT